MIQPKPHLHRATQNLYNHLHNKNYGEKFTWQELQNATQTQNLTQQQLYTIVNKVNNQLLHEDNKYLETIRSYGKRIIQPNEHRKQARNQVKKSAKIYKKAGTILAFTKIEKLNDDERKALIADANKMRTLQLFHEELFKKKRITADNRFKDPQDATTLLRLMSNK